MQKFDKIFFKLYKDQFESSLDKTIGFLKYVKNDCEYIGDVQATEIYDMAIKTVCIGLNAASNDYEFIDEINEKDVEPGFSYGNHLHFVIDHLQAFLIYLLIKGDEKNALLIKAASDLLIVSEREFMYKTRAILEESYSLENEPA